MTTKLYFSQNEFNNVENLATEAIAINGLTNKIEQLNVTNNLKDDAHKGANTPNHCAEHSDDEFQDESSLFIGDLSRTMTEEILKQTFERYGEVDSVDIKRDKVTKNNLGYGFVKFTKRQDAEIAKEKLHGAEVAGRQIRIGWAQKNTNLFVGDLDERIGNDDLRKIFRQFGPIYEEDTFVKRNKYGFVKFKHRVHAEKAKQQLDGKHLTIPSINEQTERPIRIGWGDANAQRNCVHVQFDVTLAEQQNLSEDDFIAHFNMFGHVVKVSLPRYVDRRFKGYGFIHFEENDNGEESAARAITTLNNTLIRNVMIQCNFGKRQNIKQKRRAMLHNNFEEYRFNYMSKLGEITNIQPFGLAPTRTLYQQQMYGSNLSAPFMPQMNVPCDIRQSISLQSNPQINTSAVKPLNTMPPPGPMGSYLPQQGQIPDFAKISNSHPNMIRPHIENLPPSPPPIPSPMMNAAMMGTMNESNVSLPPSISMGAPMMIPSPQMQPTTSPPPPNVNLPNINLWNNYNQFPPNMQNHVPNAPHPNMQPTMSSISPNMQPIPSLSPNMQPIMPSLSPNMQPIMPSLSPNMQPMISSISPNMQPTMPSISSNMQATIPSISSNMQPTMASISPNMQPTMPSISPNMQPMSSSSISPNIQPAMSSISSNMQSTISSISPNMQPMPMLMNNQNPPQFFAGVYRQ